MPAVPTGRVRKVRRLSPPGESGAAKRPGATGFITPSSWRAGKEAWTKPAKKDGTDDLKHPTLSVEDREESCHAHSFDSSGVSGASVTSPASSQRLVASGDHQRKGEGLSSSLARLLEDLEEGAATRERSSEREDGEGACVCVYVPTPSSDFPAAGGSLCVCMYVCVCVCHYR